MTTTPIPIWLDPDTREIVAIGENPARQGRCPRCIGGNLMGDPSELFCLQCGHQVYPDWQPDKEKPGLGGGARHNR